MQDQRRDPTVMLELNRFRPAGRGSGTPNADTEDDLFTRTGSVSRWAPTDRPLSRTAGSVLTSG